MANKRFFRFFRGELITGFFLKHLVTFPNLYLEKQGLTDELEYQKNVQWVLAEQQTEKRVAMRENDMFGIGKVAGLFQPRTFLTSNIGSIWFTKSHIVNDKERSERGFVDMDAEYFVFRRVEQDDYPDHINAEIDVAKTEGKTLRSTFIEHKQFTPAGAKLLGYVKENTNIFDAEGEIIWDNILKEPPTGCQYIEFFGMDYLVFESFFDKELPLTIDIYKMLLESLQIIRRKGASIASLMEITNFMVGGYVINIEIKHAEDDAGHKLWWYVVYYDLDPTKELYNRERRYVAWKNAMSMKFKMFQFVNRADISKNKTNKTEEKSA